jgi:hypothetical protein
VLFSIPTIILSRNQRVSSVIKGSTAVSVTGSYTSYPTNFPAVVDWEFKQQCCLTVTLRVSVNSDVKFLLRKLTNFMELSPS